MKLILFILLLATSIQAGEYAVIFIDNRVIEESVTTLLENVREVGIDANIIDSDDMPLWIDKSDTNIAGRVICVRTGSHGANDWKDMPLAFVETRVTKDVRPPDKQIIKVRSRIDFLTEYRVKP